MRFKGSGIELRQNYSLRTKYENLKVRDQSEI